MMTRAFVSPTALPRQTTSSRTAACTARGATGDLAAGKRRSAASMMAGSDSDGKPESLGDWLYRKFMHNALWEGDEEAGYEPFFVEAMTAREEQKKKVYQEREEASKSQ